MKIFLIGFMGTGKSTIGKLLAQRLGYSFIDTDSEIELRLGKEILTVFNTEGENTFRTAENELIHDIIKKPGKLVIASGGGMPCSEENLNLMNFFGTTVYLKRSVNNLYGILKQETLKRPLLFDAPDLKTKINELLETRQPCYEKSKYIIEISPDETTEEVVERICCMLNAKV
jgi:shikimate kinase